MPRPKREIPWLAARGGVFYVCWYDDQIAQTRRCSLRTSDRAEAQARYAAFLVEGEAITRPRAGGLTVSQALDAYWVEHVVKECASPIRQEIAIRHLKSFFGDLPLADVNVVRSRNYAKARHSVSDSTIRRELNVLVAAANHAVWLDRAKATVQVDLPSERVIGRDDEAPHFTKAEIDRLIAHAEGELQWFIELAYWTGARRGSIENLTRGQVDLMRKRILLQPPGKRLTKKRQPIVPILETMRPALAALMTLGGEVRLFKQKMFYRAFAGLCAKLKFPEGKRHPHLLRHSRATHLLQDGVALYTVARLLGDTPATIERVYGHHAADVMVKELEARNVATGVYDS